MSWVWALLVVATVLYHDCGYVECCVEEERLALLEINSYMQSYSDPRDHDKYIKPWYESGATDDCCKWYGIVCNDSTGRVTQLDLSRKVARLPGYSRFWKFNVTLFSPFRELVSLDLSRNDINGLVEKDGSTNITTLKNLTTLKLPGNNFERGYLSVRVLTSLRILDLSGAFLNESTFPLSQELSNLTKLHTLDLSDNYLSVAIKDLVMAISDLRELQVLDLSWNNLHGSFENLVMATSDLEELQVLDLSWNNLHGSFESICKMKNLLELHLKDNSIHGVWPSCIRNMSSLQILDLSDNYFNGRIPKVMSNLKCLENLDLSNNYFDGKFSLDSLGNLSKLHVLQLSHNNLEVQFADPLWRPNFQLQTLGLSDCNLNKTFETFTRFLSHQTNLSHLDLSNNNLHKAFPAWLCNHNLSSLYLSNNSLTGNLQLPHSVSLFMENLDVSNNNLHDKLPESIGLVFPNLQYLNLSGNHFEGPIPTSISRMEQLRALDLSNNNFSGKLPSRLLSNLSALVILKLSDNNLEGDIIPEDMNLPDMAWLKLSNNHFGGKIRDVLLKSSENLAYLDISNNRIIGELPPWIGNLSSLQSLSMSQNYLNGEIPQEICNLYLIYLDLSHNNFSGSIPSCSNSCNMYHMHLHSNCLSGFIPNSLSNCSQLQTLDLRNNQLSGGIPLWIGDLSQLMILLLARNNLHGPIPKQLCQLTHINILDLSHNGLSGGIPICIENMSFGVRIENLKLDNDQMSAINFGDSVDFELYKAPEEEELMDKNQLRSYRGKNLILMSVLDLSSNRLTGDIPPQLGKLEKLQALNLSHNLLSGSIPTQFSNLKHVESLDLSYNHLSGKFPPQLAELYFIEIFNVSYNHLSGRVPNTGQFATFDEWSYRGNTGLYGWNDIQNPVKALPPAADTQEDKGDGDDAGIDMVDFIWSFSVTCVIMFLTTMAILYINPRWREAWFEFVDWHLLRRLPFPKLSLV